VVKRKKREEVREGRILEEMNEKTRSKLKKERSGSHRSSGNKKEKFMANSNGIQTKNC